MPLRCKGFEVVLLVPSGDGLPFYVDSGGLVMVPTFAVILLYYVLSLDLVFVGTVAFIVADGSFVEVVWLVYIYLCDRLDKAVVFVRLLAIKFLAEPCVFFTRPYVKP